MVSPGVPDGTTLVNVAAVSSDTADPNDSNDRDEERTDIEARADLRLDKTADPPTLVAGDTVHYTIHVANAGPSDAQAVQVVDQVSGHGTIVHPFDLSGNT